MINAGKYNHKITIYRVIMSEDSQGFPVEELEAVLSPHAHIKTTRGMTLIRNDSDFEKAYTNFTIRYPSSASCLSNTLILSKRLLISDLSISS